VIISHVSNQMKIQFCLVRLNHFNFEQNKQLNNNLSEWYRTYLNLAFPVDSSDKTKNAPVCLLTATVTMVILNGICYGTVLNSLGTDHVRFPLNFLMFIQMQVQSEFEYRDKGCDINCNQSSYFYKCKGS